MSDEEGAGTLAVVRAHVPIGTVDALVACERMGRPSGLIVDGALLRARRVELGLTQEQVAERAGLVRHTVRAAEKGSRVAKDSVRRLAAALDLPYLSVVRPPYPEVWKRLQAVGLAPQPAPSPWIGRSAESRRLREVLKRPEERVMSCITARRGAARRRWRASWRPSWPTR